jgi:hypothetical protein
VAFKVSVMNLADMLVGWLTMYLHATAQHGTAPHNTTQHGTTEHCEAVHARCTHNVLHQLLA